MFWNVFLCCCSTCLEYLLNISELRYNLRNILYNIVSSVLFSSCAGFCKGWCQFRCLQEESQDPPCSIPISTKYGIMQFIIPHLVQMFVASGWFQWHQFSLLTMGVVICMEPCQVTPTDTCECIHGHTAEEGCLLLCLK